MSDQYIPDILSRDHTKMLIKTCYYREMAAIKAARYQRSVDQAKDMRACNAALAAAEDLLNQEVGDGVFSDHGREQVRQTLWEVVRGGLRNAIENIRNMTLRQQYICKLRENAIRFGRQIAQVAEGDIIEIRSLAEQAAGARNTVLNLTRAKLSKTARAFSQWMKERGLDFAQLRTIYTQKAQNANRIGRGAFQDLSVGDMAIVYSDIIEASGRANALVTNFSTAMGVMGAAMLILILGSLVWNVVESINPTLAAVQGAVALGAGVVGAELGTELGVAISVAGGPVGVFIGGVLGGILGGFGVGLAANSIFDAIVSALSGDIPDELIDRRIWGNPIVYAPMLPDGSELSTSLFAPDLY